jgi:PTS system galactitol-specific IIA component
MQNTLIRLLNEEHILTGVEAADAQDAIGKLTEVLVETDYVTPEFSEDVWEREGTFPTGLPTQPLAVAIPHADPDHVKRSAVCVGVLNSPVRFSQMGTDGSTVLDVPIIFLLAIKEKEKQVEMIQQLMTLIQTPELLDGLSKAESPSDAIDLIKNLLA